MDFHFLNQLSNQSDFVFFPREVYRVPMEL
jgi:hypothetical protein